MISERATSAAVRLGDPARPPARASRSGFRLPSQPPQVVQHHVEPQPGDELHHEIMVTVLPAHAEDRHDVGVVQLGRGLRLALEPPHLLGVQQRAGREHLQRHPPAERFLLGLVDHPHAAAADLAEDAVVAQPLQPDAHRRAVVGGQRAGRAAGALAQVFHHQAAPGTGRGSRRPARGSARRIRGASAARRGACGQETLSEIRVTIAA